MCKHIYQYATSGFLWVVSLLIHFNSLIILFCILDIFYNGAPTVWGGCFKEVLEELGGGRGWRWLSSAGWPLKEGIYRDPWICWCSPAAECQWTHVRSPVTSLPPGVWGQLEIVGIWKIHVVQRLIQRSKKCFGSIFCVSLKPKCLWFSGRGEHQTRWNAIDSECVLGGTQWDNFPCERIYHFSEKSVELDLKYINACFNILVEKETKRKLSEETIIIIYICTALHNVMSTFLYIGSS